MSKKIDFKNIKLLELAAVVSERLKKHQIDSILVGGACACIYCQNRYQCYGLDYVTYEDMKKIAKALLELGFQNEGSYFSHPDCKFFIDFVSPPVSIKNEPIYCFEYHQTPLGTIKMLTPTDCVKDRLSSFYHWDDKPALDQAIAICKEIFPKIDIQEIKKWSDKESFSQKYEIFLLKLKEYPEK